MYCVYILWSKRLEKLYIGQTSDLSERLNRHNKGWEKSTKPGIPWDLICTINKPSLSEARKLEKKLKNLSRQRIEDFINK